MSHKKCGEAYLFQQVAHSVGFTSNTSGSGGLLAAQGPYVGCGATDEVYVQDVQALVSSLGTAG